jgi:hypothetical protein
MSRESKKERLLILGSGFSKAVSDKMPVVRELAQALKEHIEKNQDRDLQALKEPQYQHLLNDPEMLLTYLAQDQPWKEPDETHKDRALFLRVATWLARYIENCEDLAFKGNNIKDWVIDLASWLHHTKTPTITFNYDTVLERVCYLHVKAKTWVLKNQYPPWSEEDLPLYASNLYQMPLGMIPHRAGPASLPLPQSTFHLIKLHGSINWFYSGGEQFPGEQVYFRSVDSVSPYSDMTGVDDLARWAIGGLSWGGPPPPFDLKTEIKKLLSDKVPLIIPPVAEKSRFYANQTIRSLWGKAREYLAQAEEIYCVGYSLPDTDLTVKLLLQTACAGRAKTVYIVNNDVKGKEDLVRRYRDAFPKEVAIKDDYIRADAVEAMIKDLCKEG